MARALRIYHNIRRTLEKPVVQHQRLRSQLSSVSDETARCGGHKNLNELFAVLQSCYLRGAAWTDYMDVVKFVYLRPVTQEELAVVLAK